MDDLEQIVEYLQDGLLVVASPGVGTDVLCPTAGPIDSPHLLTDGVWIWPADLAYYLERYKVGLPEAFVGHVRDRRYAIPAEETVSITDIEY